MNFHFRASICSRNVVLLLAGWVAVSTGVPIAGQESKASGSSPVSNTSKVDFNREVRPILSENCYKCHGPDEGSRKAKLRFDLASEPLKPAKSGKIAIVPGAPDKSELIARITATDEDDRMPPVKTGKKLSAHQMDVLRRWIAQGAAYAKHWSYANPVRPALPQVRNRRWPHNPVDRFILARLEHEGLKPSPVADRYTLIRRVSLDLTGLPPTLEEVDQFVGDRDPLAYEHLVDRLLSRPAFGEHWARLWLDLARYADSAGYADDPPRTIWAYRDWVIRAFNANKPFDRFTLEQIAGDLLSDADEDDLIATAFHRNTMTNNEGGTNDEEFRNAAIVDRVNTTMAVWMATSMGCAQCHNHKYDPITQQDYFRLFAILNNTEDADLKEETPVLELYTQQQKNQRKELQADIAQIETTLKTPTAETKANQEKWERNFPRQIEWRALSPATFKSRSGGEIAASGEHAVRLSPLQKDEVYSLELPLAGTRFTALRIETRAAISNREPALAANGDFSVTRVSAKILGAPASVPAGRFVRIELPGKERILSLAEVQVFQGTTNLALKGGATQSSTAFEGAPERAIDGNTDGEYNSKSTSHTETSENPWWEVDLKQAFGIDRLVIWNRTDNDLQKRLSDFHLSILDEKRETVWEKNVKEPPNPSSAFALDGSQEIRFVAVFADTNQVNLKSVLEGKRPGWPIEGQSSAWRHLTLVPANPLPIAPGSRLALEIKQEAQHDRCLAALLRVSSTEDEHVGEYARVSDSVLDALAQTPVTRTERQQKLIADYYLAQVEPGLNPQRDRLAALKKQLSGMQPNTVPIMRELTGAKRRKTHIQFRGNYQALGDEVTEAVPAAFHALPAQAKPDRLGLAEWIVDGNNPLTARVIVNRFWEQIFGLGIVRTCEDFGTQGDLPSHPELLDWLATEFMAKGWDMKGFLKLLVTSATYCQSARVTPDLQERDPDNILLARGPRSRSCAEVVRDQALSVSGLLSKKMYGAPVRPPQPSFGLTAAFGSTFDWKTSEGEDRYRRAVYTEWRRTSPYPSMTTFDAPNREVCALRRPRSNTPLQALVTLNDPVYVEAAQALAQRMLGFNGLIPEKARFGFRLCLARPPRANELKELTDLFRDARGQYAAHADQAEKMAGAQPGKIKGEELPDLAAWTTVANVLLNLDETLMKP